MNKKVHVIGGGTFSYIRNHLALAAVAYGNTARTIADLVSNHPDNKLDVVLHLTRMAGGLETLETNDQIESLINTLISDPTTKIIFMNVALCDFTGNIQEHTINKYNFSQLVNSKSGKYETRLKTSDGSQIVTLTPAEKILNKIRKTRKDITLVAFKTTCGATEKEQYLAGLELLKKNSCNLVLANDTKTRLNMIITPEESRYHTTTDRQDVLENLVDMAIKRSHLTFTRSTVVAGEDVAWDNKELPQSLLDVVNHCIKQDAYKPFMGATVGHFAYKVNDTEFITSKRKTNFNKLSEVGLVRVKTDGPDSVIAYGSKPSVGGQSQRIVFSKNPDLDCIVHFHCPKREGSKVPVKSQREIECGSHACGENTANGLEKFGNLLAVMLDNHGPNIVFSKNIDSQEVINFIEENFDLSLKTGGYVS